MCATAETMKHLQAALLEQSGRTISASSRASGTSALLSTMMRVRSDSGRPPRVSSGTYARQLGLDHVEVGHRVAAGLERGAVDDVHEHRAALDVPQELQPEALALAGARDEPGHVGDGEALSTRR